MGPTHCVSQSSRQGSGKMLIMEWLERRVNRRAPGGGRRKRARQLSVEHLEVRIAPAAVTWVAGSGDWNTGSNWSTGKVPGAGDDVTISALSATITHTSTGSDA